MHSQRMDVEADFSSSLLRRFLSQMYEGWIVSKVRSLFWRRIVSTGGGAFQLEGAFDLEEGVVSTGGSAFQLEDTRFRMHLIWRRG